MSIFGNLDKAKDKAGKKGAGFFEEPGAYMVSVKEVYLGTVTNPKKPTAGQSFATITYTVRETLSGSLIAGDERKAYYGLGFDGSTASKHEIAMANLVKDIASLLGIDVEAITQEAMDGFFHDDGAALAVGAEAKVEVVAVEKNGRTYHNLNVRGTKPVTDPATLLEALGGA